MKKRLAAALFCVFLSSVCHAETFDVGFPSGLTVKLYGGSSWACPECGLEQGYSFVSFVEPLNQPWYPTCVNGRFYISANSGGKILYQSILLAHLTGKKVTRIIGNTPDPNHSNICTLNWAQVE
jgi:hypothetical protein